MKILMSLLFLLSSPIYAQTDIVFKDDFTDNRYDWWEGPATRKNIFLNGSFILRSGNQLLKGISVNPKQDFAVVASMKQTEGTIDKAFGIGCGLDEEMSYNFLISSKGAFIIYGWKANKNVVFKDWDSSFDSIIKPMGSLNKLKIEQKGNITSFYINSTRVYYSSGLILADNKIGLCTTYGISVAYDNLTVYQKSSPVNLLSGYSTDFKRENLGPEVNCKYDDCEPIISHDGKTLYYRRFDNLIGQRYASDPNCGDIYSSSLTESGAWSKAEKLSYPVNNSHNNELVGISPDNNTLYMGDTNCFPRSNNFKFWESRRAGGGWTVPKPVSIINPGNNDHYFTATISADGQTALIALNRNDSRGDMDIYVCFLQNGVWSEPKNLGPVINTYGLDLGPFLAADNETMYFATDGLPGYGNEDIFVSKRLDDTWLNWSKPQNLGPGINSTGSDVYYSVPASGEYAYFHSTSNSIGERDIFRIKLPKEAKPEPVVLIHGKALNITTNMPVSASIHYRTLPDGKDLGSARTNPGTGEYKIILPYGKQYAYHATAIGYIEVNENFDLIEKRDYIEINKDLYLIPIEVGAKISLNHVFFEQGKPVLINTSYPELNRLVEIMNENPQMEIELRGHTDNAGDAAKNMTLSQERVRVVKEYLVSKGISEKRISGKGYGSTQPISTNADEESRKLNRRVEFVITKK
jgi:outer membrane protein OmpA-like peptidoglycan-associated protein